MRVETGLRPAQLPETLNLKPPGMRARGTRDREATNQREGMNRGPEMGMHRAQASGTLGSAARPGTGAVLCLYVTHVGDTKAREPEAPDTSNLLNTLLAAT